MMSRPPSLAPLRRLVVPAFAALATTLLLSGCCSTYEEEICILVDHGDTCPDEDGAEARWGYDIQDGPRQALLVDGRSERDKDMYGTVCCYKAKFESCSSMRSVY